MFSNSVVRNDSGIGALSSWQLVLTIRAVCFMPGPLLKTSHDLTLCVCVCSKKIQATPWIYGGLTDRNNGVRKENVDSFSKRAPRE